MPDNLLRYIYTAIMLFSLYGCGTTPGLQQDGPPSEPMDISNIPDAVPKNEPRSRYGNPDSYVVLGRRYHVMNSSHGYTERGIASWYGKKFHGRRTSSGETYNMHSMTAAHKSLPLPSYVRVRNLENGRSVIVKVNDRGPFHDNRIIDMSYAAASKLGMMATGTALVEVKAISTDSDRQMAAAQPRESPVKKTASINKFFIQCGAFSELDNAKRLRERLQDIKIDPAHVSKVIVDGRTLFRVRIGPLVDVSAADRIVAKLTEFGIYDHHIVIE